MNSMKRYIRTNQDYTTDTLVSDNTVTNTDLVSKYGDDGVVYEFDNFEEAWEWLNAKED